MKRSWRLIIHFLATAFLLICPLKCAHAEDPIYRFRAGFHLSEEHPPTAKQLKLLLNELRSLTGFAEMLTKPDGDISLGNHSLTGGGSEIARKLFTTAIDGHDSFILESRDHTATIAFAQIESLLVYTDSAGQVHHEWHIRIDFADFKELRGDKTAIASFGPGMNLLHELVHAILGYPDPLTSADPLGQCERHLNLIRADLRLPLRQHYYPRSRFAVSPESIAQIFQGEISFSRSDESSKQLREFSLTFNVDRVLDVSRRPPNLIYSDLARLSTK